MNDLEKMKKEVEIKKKALNSIYGRESIENNPVTFTESIWYIYELIKEKIKNADYRYSFTKDPELKGEVDAYNDILVLLETKFTFLTITNKVQTNTDDSVKLPDGIARRLTKVLVCPDCESNNIELLNKITRVNNWDVQKPEKITAQYKCLNCGKEFRVVLLDNTNNIETNIDLIKNKIPYSEDTTFSFTTKENKDANTKDMH